MVQLIRTPRLTDAIKAYNALPSTPIPSRIPVDVHSLSHSTILEISDNLLSNLPPTAPYSDREKYAFPTLLRGAGVYIPPPPKKKEPTEEYKQLMARLRREQEEAEYKKMLLDSEKVGLPDHEAKNAASWDDEMTMREIKDQISVIFNVLFSVFATAAAVWMVASSWEITLRLALAFTAALVVLIAEVVIYGGYLRRQELAKVKEKRKPERKRIVKVLPVGGTGIHEHID